MKKSKINWIYIEGIAIAYYTKKSLVLSNGWLRHTERKLKIIEDK